MDSVSNHETTHFPPWVVAFRIGNPRLFGTLAWTNGGQRPTSGITYCAQGIPTMGTFGNYLAPVTWHRTPLVVVLLTFLVNVVVVVVVVVLCVFVCHLNLYCGGFRLWELEVEQ